MGFISIARCFFLTGTTSKRLVNKYILINSKDTLCIITCNFLTNKFINIILLGFCKGQGMQCVIGGPPPQCCGYLNCSPTQTRPTGFVGGYGICSRGDLMNSKIHNSMKSLI